MQKSRTGVVCGRMGPYGPLMVPTRAVHGLFTISKPVRGPKAYIMYALKIFGPRTGSQNSYGAARGPYYGPREWTYDFCWKQPVNSPFEARECAVTGALVNGEPEEYGWMNTCNKQHRRETQNITTTKQSIAHGLWWKLYTRMVAACEAVSFRWKARWSHYYYIHERWLHQSNYHNYLSNSSASEKRTDKNIIFTKYFMISLRSLSIE